jgi:fucose permease
MNAEQIHNFKVLMLENTLEPYKYMIMVLVVVMVLFLLTRFPTCKVAQTASHKRPSAMDTLRYLASNARFRRGIVAQFLYVGMQVAVWSFTIRLALELGDINERDASTFMVYSFACFFIGKFIANILMTLQSGKSADPILHHWRAVPRLCCAGAKLQRRVRRRAGERPVWTLLGDNLRRYAGYRG